MEWLETSIFGRLINNTLWGFPINEILHIFAMALVIGAIVAFSARVFGVSSIPPASLARVLTPILILGAAVSLVTGFLFFAAWPYTYLGNPVFQAKMLLLLLMLALSVTAVIQVRRQGAFMLGTAPASIGLRWQAALILVLVFLILLAGRLIPYWRSLAP